MAAGADYYMAKPFDLEVLARRIRRLAALPPERPQELQSCASCPQSTDLQRSIYDVEVSKTLHRMGVPANLKGYLYLKDAIIMALERGGTAQEA